MLLAQFTGYTIPNLFASPEPEWPKIVPNKLKLLDLMTIKNDMIWLRYRVIYD